MNLSIKNKSIQISVKIYLIFIIGFYPLALMYKDAYQVVPIKLEGVLYSIFVGMIFNLGLFMSLTDFGLKWKKLTLCFLLISAATSWFIFYLPSVNPMASISDAEWEYVSAVFSYFALAFVMLVMILVGVYKYER
jgi:hypothetical protein